MMMENSHSQLSQLVKSMDMSFGQSDIVPVELLLKALMEPDSELDRWITMNSMKEEGRAYMIENESSFRYISFLHMISGVDLDEVEISTSTIADIYFLIPGLKEAISTIRDRSRNRDVKELMNFYDVEKLERFVTLLEAKNEAYRTAQLTAEPMSPLKVDAFREMIASQWRQSRTLSKVFEFFDAVKYNPEEELKWVGLHRIRFKGAKLMFVERSYQKIYNIEWGHEVSNEVTRFFLSSIKEEKEKFVIDSDTYIGALDEIIGSNLNINIAFISLAGSYQAYRPLQESGNFTDYSQGRQSDLPFPILGIYKERIIIIPLRNKSMGDYVIGFQLPGALIMKRKLNDSWIDQKLQLDISEINDENVKRVLLDSDPKADVTDQKLLADAKTGVLIEIDELIDFEIKDPKSIIVARVKERID